MPTHYYCDEGTDEDPTPVHRCNQNEPTNHPAPVILDEAALEEIEARPYYYVGLGRRVELHPDERDALCATVRAAWAQVEKQDAIISAYENNDEEALAEAENL